MKNNNNNNSNNNNFVASVKIDDQQKLTALMICANLIDQTLNDTIINSMHEGALITSILRLYLYAETIYLLSKSSSVYHVIQNFISELCIAAIEELKKKNRKDSQDNGHK